MRVLGSDKIEGRAGDDQGWLGGELSYSKHAVCGTYENSRSNQSVVGR